LYQADFAAVKQKLAGYGVRLDSEDLRKIEYVYRSFHSEGLDLRFSSLGRNNASQYPTFESLLLQTDRAGKLQNYLGDEESFQWMKQFEAENRLIPIVGDFSGPHAFKAVGAFLSKNGLKVSTFYTSNVEYYLFGGPQWAAYLQNVRSLPLQDKAVLSAPILQAPVRLIHRQLPGIAPHRWFRISQRFSPMKRPEEFGSTGMSSTASSSPFKQTI